MSRNPALYGTDELAESLLTNSKKFAVVGLGTDPEKAVYRVAQFLQKKGIRVIPIHPRGESVLGEKTFTSLTDAIVEHPDIDVVDCFVASQRVGRVMQEAIDLKLPALWLQLEIVDEEKAQAAVDAGISVIMDRCPAIEWPRLKIQRAL